MQMSFALWMALARAAPMNHGPDDDAQASLGDSAADAPEP